MRNARSILGHPICLVVFSVALGYGIHRVTADRGIEERVQAPAEKLIGEPRGATDESIGTPRPASTGPASTGTPIVAVAQAESDDSTPGAPKPSEPAPRASPPSIDELAPVEFDEIWAYLMPGEEEKWNVDAEVTDVCLFNYSLDETGKLKGRSPDEAIRLAARRGVRTHLCVSSSGQKSLLHFLVNPNYGQRERFVAELARLARTHDVDGFQLDFESLLLIDRMHFTTFLRKLRSKLPEGMTFSIALPAREKIKPSDTFRYRGLEHVADRFFIMAYDQHWKGGGPGSISGKLWFDRVTAHALAELPPDRVVLGLPFYGRLWRRDELGDPTKHPQLDALAAQVGARIVYDPVETNHFTFEKAVTYECWFEDAVTLREKMSSARAAGARCIGFWRLSQEDPRVWKLVRRTRHGE